MYPSDIILVVEDDANHYKLIQLGFQRGRIANPLHRVATAEDAIAYLNGDGAFADRDVYPVPCLILLDLTLPGGSGFAVLEWVRKHSAFKKAPVVVFTVSRNQADIERAYQLGANSYLVKPFDVEELRASIKALNAYWVLLAQKPRLG